MSTRFWIYSTLLILAAVCFSCGKERQKLDPEQYLIAAKSNADLQVEKEFKDVTFQVRYRSTDELILDEVSDKKLTDSLYHKLRNKYKTLQYFTFTIVSARSAEILSHYEGEEDYYKLLDYLSSSIQNDFALVDNNDTLACVLAHYERNFGLSSSNRISLAFEDKDQGKVKYPSDKILLYDDKLFETGLISFRFEKENLNNLPHLAHEN